MRVTIIALFMSVIFPLAGNSIIVSDQDLADLSEYEELLTREKEIYSIFEKPGPTDDINQYERELQDVQERIDELYFKLLLFMDEYGDIYSEVMYYLDDYRLSQNSCLPSSKPLSNQSIKIILETSRIGQLLEKQKILEKINKLSGFKSRECLPSVPNQSYDNCDKAGTCNCWEDDRGLISYRTKGHFRISTECLFKYQKNAYTETQGSFEKNPLDLLTSAELAYKKVSSCYQNLDRKKAQNLASILKNLKPYIFCKAPSNTECGYVAKNTFEIVITSAPRCKSKSTASTIFHELMHVHDNVCGEQKTNREGAISHSYPQFKNIPKIGNTIGKLSMDSHNSGLCNYVDPIHYCTHLCFDDKKNSTFKENETGCRNCVKNENNRICDQVITTYDQDYLNSLERCK